MMLQADDIDLGFHVDMALFKARPATEGDGRFIYCEPSNENWDADGERVLQKALAASADHFLKFGNLDIAHKTMLGHRIGLDYPEIYEIGRPVEVRTEPRIMLKGEIYRGSGKTVEQANLFWASLTEQQPPKQWYPSIGGRSGPKDTDAKGRSTITKVVWTNVGFANEPVNRTVKSVSLTHDEFLKAVTAGYQTDVAQLEGGQAVQKQSIRKKKLIRQTQDAPMTRYLADRAFGRKGRCPHCRGDVTIKAVVDHFRLCEGMLDGDAREYATEFMRILVEANR